MGAPRRANRGSNKNDVPSWKQRQALNAWMLGTFGDGITAPCAFCGRQLLCSQLTRDRHPKPGRKGGRYVKGNIRPACMSCNASDGARQAAIERAKMEARRIWRPESPADEARGPYPVGWGPLVVGAVSPRRRWS